MKVRKVEKPWGYELIWAETGRYAAKLIFIKENRRLSLQVHNEKDQTMWLFSGSVVLTLDGKEVVMVEDESYHLYPGVPHRLTAFEDSQVLEASSPELGDVIRIEDDYDRIGK